MVRTAPELSVVGRACTSGDALDRLLTKLRHASAGSVERRIGAEVQEVMRPRGR